MHEKTTLLTSNAWLYAITGAVIATGMFFFGIQENNLRNSGFALVALYLCYLLFLRSRLVFTKTHLIITNPLVKHVIGWQDIETMGAGMGFYVVQNGKKIHAFAAPAPGRHHARRLNQDNLRGTRHEGTDTMRSADSPASDSGSALVVAERYAKEGTSGESTKHIDYLSIGVLSVLIAISLLV